MMQIIAVFMYIKAGSLHFGNKDFGHYTCQFWAAVICLLLVDDPHKF